jgi:5-dehydro-2-deoxygluconokinase
MSDASLDLLAVGRNCVDLYAEQLRVSFTEITSFRKSIGGTATNVAVAAARLGHRAALFTKVGDDPFGAYVRHALSETFGVDTRFVGVHPTLRTALAFAELLEPGEPNILFYRQPKAPDMTIEIDDIDLDVVRDVPLLWVPGGALAEEPSRSTVYSMLAHRRRAPHTVLDLDWRPALWTSEAEGSEHIGAALEHVTLAIGNLAECHIAVGTSNPEYAAERLLARGVRGAIVKMGADGVLVATCEGVRERVLPHAVDVVCGLGAGDAFGGAICHGLLSGWDLVRSVRAANVAGALVAARLMCADDMPYLHEIVEMLDAAQ